MCLPLQYSLVSCFSKIVLVKNTPLVPSLAPHSTFGYPHWPTVSLLNAPIKTKQAKLLVCSAVNPYLALPLFFFFKPKGQISSLGPSQHKLYIVCLHICPVYVYPTRLVIRKYAVHVRSCVTAGCCMRSALYIEHARVRSL